MIRLNKWISVLALVVAMLATTALHVRAEAMEAEPGVLIVSVVEDSPAAEAGLKRGDIVLAVDDKPVNTADELANAVLEAQPGDTLMLTVLHGDDEYNLEVTLDERDGYAFLGVRPYIEPASTEQFRRMVPRPIEPPQRFSMPAIPLGQGVGALILEVIEESPAAIAGLKQNDVIVGIDGQALEAEESLAERIGTYKPGDSIALDVRKAGRVEATQEVTATLAAHPEDETRPYLGVRYMPLDAGMEGGFLMPGMPLHRPGFFFFAPPPGGRYHWRMPRYWGDDPHSSPVRPRGFRFRQRWDDPEGVQGFFFMPPLGYGGEEFKQFEHPVTPESFLIPLVNWRQISSGRRFLVWTMYSQ